jgi:membrane-associated phospholipid phosphatase
MKSKRGVKNSKSRKESRLGKEAGILLRDKYFYIGLAVLIAGVMGNSVSSYYLFQKFGDSLPVLPDIILDLIPRLHLWYIYNSVIVISLALFIFYMYKKAFRKIPYFLILLGAYQVLRAVFVILTPFGNPSGTSGGIFAKFFQYGLFPSGHTGLEFLLFLLTTGKYKKIFFLFTLIMAVTLLLAGTHYTLDIFSAIIFAYAVYYFGKKHLHKFIVKE